MENSNNQTTYLVVDGENIDATLGLSVLDRRPNPEERPRWDRVLECAHSRWGQRAKGLFFLNGSSGFLPMGFVQALTAMDYSVIPLSGPADMKVVDVGLQRTMDAIAQIGTALLDQGRRVAVMCFKEFLSSQLHELEERGLEIIDLEYDVHAFQVRLPRLHIIDIDDFDPMSFL